MTIVCGDSHTSTHGAFGALAFGIGTSEVEHVLATQTLPLRPFKTMAVTVDGALPPGVTAKDIILAVIAKIGTGGGQGYVIEYRGSAIEALSMEGRMTICNMCIEAGARAGMVAPDETTFEYHARAARTRRQGADWDAAVASWSELRTDDGAEFDTEVHIDASTLSPFVTWGTNPGQGVPLSDSVPDPELMVDDAERPVGREGAGVHGPCRPARRCVTSRSTRCSSARARTAGSRICGPSPRCCGVARSPTACGCWSSRARCGCARRPRPKAWARSSPPAGAEWRQAGCSMCLGMNPDQLAPGERCASTSNRNFEGRQGKGGRTHLVSPLVAAATAVRGTLSSPADLRLTLTRTRRPSMEAFTHPHRASAFPLRRRNVDTDQIIPAVYLKRVTRTGFEDGLFAAWRERPVVRAEQPALRQGLGIWWPVPISAPVPRANMRSGR